MAESQKISDILSKIYYDASNPGGFDSQARLLHEANLIDPKITLKNVQDWLRGQLTYTLHRSARRNFLRNKIIFAWAIPIQNKGSKSVSKAFRSLFENSKRVPTKLQTDKGTEFLNREVQNVFKEYGVHHFTAINLKTKCSVVERFNRTLKSKMFKFFTANGTRKYIATLPALVKSYNNSIHRGPGKRPAWVNDSHKKEIMHKLYGVLSRRELLRKHYMMNKGRSSKVAVGDKFRKTYELKPGFDKAYYPNWTDQTFNVEKIIGRIPKSVYKIIDEDGKSSDRLFYPEEIQKIDSEGLYRVEKVIKRRRKRDGDVEYFVKFLGYP
ncbi:uncharacterized protein LOC141857597 [Brevipalpus obovatus]|uniref:uncharacterized protein LOC141857597 n=1 Tax=Brevipalpus obovatus TaxID=246614 RepID=UPI003D9E806D